LVVTNGSNIRKLRAGGIPDPLSLTAVTTAPFSRRQSTQTLPPALVASMLHSLGISPHDALTMADGGPVPQVEELVPIAEAFA